MANEFTKSTKIKPAIVGTIADPDEYNQNIAGQSKDAIIGIDADGNFSDSDIGDENLGTNGSLINNIKLREGGLLKIYNASGVFQNNVNLGQAEIDLLGQTLLPKQVTCSNNSTDSDHDMDFTSGNFQFDDGTGQAEIGALTKQIDTNWVAGTNQGGLDTGTVAADTPYYIWQIHNPTSNLSDILYSASSTSPTLPSGYTKKNYLAALFTDGSANIRNGTYTFDIKSGKYKFIYDTSILNYTGNVFSSAQNKNVTVLSKSVEAIVEFISTHGPNFNYNIYGLASSLLKNDEAPSSSNCNWFAHGTGGSYRNNYGNTLFIESNTGQIRLRFSTSASVLYSLRTLGWIDYLS